MTDDGIRLEERTPEGTSAASTIERLDADDPAAAGLEAERSAGAADTLRLRPVEADEVELSLFGDLTAVEPLWSAFEDQASRTFFQTFAWLDAWQAHVGERTGTTPAIVTGRHPDGALLFILPLAIERRRGVRHVTFLGSDLCDYNAPLLNPEFGSVIDDRVFAALWARILGRLGGDRRFAFDVVDLPKMPERVGEQHNPLVGLRTQPNPSGAYLTALGGSWDEFYQRKRSAATRKKERKQLRQLGEFGEVRFIDQLEGEERIKTLDVLFEQKARSFARMGVRNIFKRPGYSELFRAFATDARSRHLVHLSRLEVGSTIAAASIGFTACSCYYLVLSSYDGGAMARLGPGRSHLQELLRFAIRSSIHTFDFTIGDELYKQDWSDARVTLHDHLSAVSASGAVAVGLIIGFRKAKRTIKQNAALWRLFSRARSRLGAIRSRRSAIVSPAGDTDQAGDTDA